MDHQLPTLDWGGFHIFSIGQSINLPISYPSPKQTHQRGSLTNCQSRSMWRVGNLDLISQLQTPLSGLYDFVEWFKYTITPSSRLPYSKPSTFSSRSSFTCSGKRSTLPRPLPYSC